ncbi:Uncharacterised protein r2_g215 [Pycnogonum litorale]
MVERGLCLLETPESPYPLPMLPQESFLPEKEPKRINVNQALKQVLKAKTGHLGFKPERLQHFSRTLKVGHTELQNGLTRVKFLEEWQSSRIRTLNWRSHRNK